MQLSDCMRVLLQLCYDLAWQDIQEQRLQFSVGTRGLLLGAIDGDFIGHDERSQHARDADRIHRRNYR